ncbi:myotubularin-related protein 3 isoform X2 [Neocloeon triangulifer]|uniref:myotubularin-related protein 3 isoform X2 n=1 Tax=Neocloeon triangulifer TaxID=2078957 RepID=UPI00286EDE06|nr:myotubularin-related protein 3 isoform X2 [Neocloeon triangulifer]
MPDLDEILSDLIGSTHTPYQPKSIEMKLTAATMTSELDEPMTVPSLHSLCNVNASELYPKQDLQEATLAEDVQPDSLNSGPFGPVFGESIEHLSRVSDGGLLALSNYRVFLQNEGCSYNIPLTVIDVVEVRDLFYLHILCKDAQSVRCSFSSGEACTEWQRRITKAATQPRVLEKVFALAFFAWANDEADEEAWSKLGGRSEGPTNPALIGSVEASEHNFHSEIERLGFDLRGPWRVSKLNYEYSLCPSYPRLLLLPSCITDEALEAVARFRSARRVPAVVWRHTNGAVLARCSQPEVGWLGWRSAEDEELIRAIAEACACEEVTSKGEGELADEPQSQPDSKNVLIVDARSYTTAVANRARGGGCECPEYYPKCDISFMNLANIHAVRKSSQALRSLCASEDQPNWFSQLEGSRWFQLISGLLRAAVAVSAAMEREARPVLVHCSDGWDRTPQIVALAQLLLDPYYRTIDGFQILIEREWLDFGHKFGDRCGLGAGATDDINERSPVFLQWLDCVHQLLTQFPCAFQFSHAYLVRLAQHVYSNMFGTFLCNSQQERAKLRVAERSLSVWRFLKANPGCHNLLYSGNQQVLWPLCSVRDLRLWTEVYLGGVVRTVDAAPPTSPPPNLCKSRSCEDLQQALHTPSIQTRRNSHPSLTDSTIESLLLNSEPVTKDEEVEDSENGDAVDGVVPSPVIPPPPPMPSVESSTDTLVPTEITNGIATREDSPKLQQTHQVIDQNGSECHVCASSRKFLLESSVLELCSNNNGGLHNGHTRTSSHYSTPTSYPPTPGSGSTAGEDEAQRANHNHKCQLPVTPLPMLTSKVDIDGLSTLQSDIQTRLRHIFSDFQSQVEALQRELHTTRMALIQQVCHHCSPGMTNGDHRTDETGSLPDSVDSMAEHAANGSLNSRPASDVSWETVEEKDALPTLWMPDHAVRRCMGCDTEFWLGRRKHHCRNCGQIFCNDCSWNTAPLPSEQLYEPVRVCANCYREIANSGMQLIPNGSPLPMTNGQQACKQTTAHHDKLQKPIVSTGTT